MGSTSACAAEESFVAAYGLPYKLDMKSFGGQKSCKSDEFRSLSGSSEGVLADLGLATTGSARDADSFKIHSVLSKGNTMHTLANPVDMKASKKHDKALPCPRCNSLDTKFCYYNNYNVNQPRHFCKGCQRYWTAGGTLRNVAIGAGRRKRKHTSLESDSQDSALEDCSSHDLPVKVSGSAESGSAMDKVAHGTSQFMKHQVFPFERIQGAALSYPPAPEVKKSSVSEYMHTNELVIPHDKVVPLSNSQSFKEQARTFYEYLRPKHMEAQLDNAKTPGNVHECARDVIDVEHVKMSTFNVQTDLRHNECNSVGSKLISTTSSEMQVSNESGCVSSLTTQAVSADACVTDGKSDGMDSEVTKEGDEPHKGGSYVSTILQTAHISPCKAHMDGSRLATSSFVHRDSNSVATIAPTWKGLPENSAFKSAWTMISAAPTWGPPADSAHTWGFPWGPAANAVDAAKAALIPTAGASLKHLAEPTCTPEMRLWVPKTLRIKDADEAARSSIWSTLGIKDRQGSVLSEKVEAVFQCHAKEGGARSTQLQHTSPVALTQSMAFQESS